MKMALRDYERKDMISEFQAITDELVLVEFMRKYLKKDYLDVFEMEDEEKIKSDPSYKIEKYTIRKLKEYISSKHNIDFYYDELNNLKIIIFYQDMIMYLDDRKIENEERNKIIKENKEAYNFFKALISRDKCNIARYTNVLRKIGKAYITQQDIDEDITRGLREGLAEIIKDTILNKYIEEYKNYL